MPTPQRQRWQPLRSGLINIYRYDAEEFYFEDGHLLLRGNNGTGKSRVLALQLPFLLDGEISPRRLEPDGDPSKRIEWNLLMDKHEDRCGYTWIEFGRRDELGQEYYLTLAIGLLAVKGQGLSDRWYLVTPQRVGRDFFLQGKDRQVFGKRQLKEEFLQKQLKDVIFPDTARAYRHAVDEALFQLGEHRYEALVELLIQLRHPQLSRNLDERKLSSVLSEALPPLPSLILNDIAESFRNLENEQKELEALLLVLKGLETFSIPYRRYIQWELRERSLKVREAHQQVDKTQREVKQGEQSLDVARQQYNDTIELERQRHLEQEEAQSQLSALESSPEMKEARRLDDLKLQLDQMERDHEHLQQSYQRALSQLKKNQQRRSSEEMKRATLFKTLGETSQSVREYCVQLPFFKEASEQLFWTDPLEAEVAPDLQTQLQERLQNWKAQLAKVRQALALLQRLEQNLKVVQQNLLLARRQQDTQRSEVEQALQELEACQKKLSHLCRDTWQKMLQWSHGLKVLPQPNMAELQNAYEDWCGQAQGPDPLQLAVKLAFEARLEALLREHQELEQQLQFQKQELQTCQREKSQLGSGLDAGPLQSLWKNLEARQGREGVPLWQVLDFNEGLSEMDKASIEAALEASGLLDAWLLPGGRLMRPEDTDDIFLEVGPESIACASNLRAVLKVAIDPEVAKMIHERDVERCLEHIGWGEQRTSCWIAVEGDGRLGQGTFCLGPQRGRWAKERAQHLGHSARAETRRRRLAELDKLMAEIEQGIAQNQLRSREVQQLKISLKQERDGLPSTHPIQQGHATLAQVQLHLENSRLKMEQVDRAVETIQGQLKPLQAELEASAKDFKCLDWLGKFDNLRDTLDELQSGIKDWERETQQWMGCLQSCIQLRQDEAEAHEHCERERESELDLSARLSSHRQQWQTLHQTAGRSIQELQHQISAVRLQIQKLVGELKQLQHQKSDLERSLVRQEERLVHLRIKWQELSTERAERSEHLKSLLSTGLQHLIFSPEAGPSSNADLTLGGVSSNVDLARQWLALLPPESEATVNGEVLYNQAESGIRPLENILGTQGGYRVVRHRVNELLVVEVEYQAQRHNLSALSRILNGEIHHRQTVLDNHERDILEKHLIGEVAAHLHEMIHNGEHWVLEVNRELAKRPMDTGMQLRFAWRVLSDQDESLPQARQQLWANSGTWSESQRREMGQFLHNRIRWVKSQKNGEGSWVEHLQEAFDYRSWHQFQVELKKSHDSTWKRMTRHVFGTGSGGEKAVALTLPQFAAAAAHYRSAQPNAPRLIMMDEVFVGVDSDMRGKCMGLLQVFDLDFVMTSEREWGTYPTVSGLAIYQLATRPGFEAVGVTRWVWNGKERQRLEAIQPQVCDDSSGASDPMVELDDGLE